MSETCKDEAKQRQYVTHDAVRELAREALYAGSTTLDAVEDKRPSIDVNPIVDPSATNIDVANSRFVPQDKPELVVALRQLVDDLPIDDVPAFYRTFQASLVAHNRNKEKDPQMKYNAKNEPSRTEEALRREIRKVLHEITPRFDTSYSGMNYSDESDESDES